MLKKLGCASSSKRPCYVFNFVAVWFNLHSQPVIDFGAARGTFVLYFQTFEQVRVCLRFPGSREYSAICLENKLPAHLPDTYTNTREFFFDGPATAIKLVSL